MNHKDKFGYLTINQKKAVSKDMLYVVEDNEDKFLGFISSKTNVKQFLKDYKGQIGISAHIVKFKNDGYYGYRKRQDIPVVLRGWNGNHI